MKKGEENGREYSREREEGKLIRLRPKVRPLPIGLVLPEVSPTFFDRLLFLWCFLIIPLLLSFIGSNLLDLCTWKVSLARPCTVQT